LTPPWPRLPQGRIRRNGPATHRHLPILRGRARIRRLRPALSRRNRGLCADRRRSAGSNDSDLESLKAKGFDKTGTLNIGGSIATAGRVIFIGATIDCRFRAFESRTGKQLWETGLPACAHTTPITFLGKDGRQYVVVAAGAGSFLGAAPGSKIVAFALPRAAASGQ
jgi:hypothetical protein